MTFDWSMVLSKSDLRDPLNPHFFSSEKNYVYLQKNYLCQLNTMPNFKYLNWVLVDPIRLPTLVKNANKKTFWGTSKNLWLDLKVCADLSWLLVWKMVLEVVCSLCCVDLACSLVNPAQGSHHFLGLSITNSHHQLGLGSRMSQYSDGTVRYSIAQHNT